MPYSQKELAKAYQDHNGRPFFEILTLLKKFAMLYTTSMKKLLSQVIVGIAGLWLATRFVPGVNIELLSGSNFFGIPLNHQWQIILILGVVLGLLNFFLRPILKILALPIAILTLGLFSFVINVMMIWIVDVLFVEFSAPFFAPLLWTTIIVWGLGFILNILLPKEED